MGNFEFTLKMESWSKKTKQGVKPELLKQLIENQKGKCKLTGVDLEFDKSKLYEEENKGHCNPIYAVVDHISPSDKGTRIDSIDEVQILCFAINDMKGNIPKKLFETLIKTNEWEKFVGDWKDCVSENKDNIFEMCSFIKEYDKKPKS
jgi:hypothetical protein